MKRRLCVFLLAIVLVGIVLYPVEVDAICARTYDGAYGFYYSRGSEDAMAVLDWGATFDGINEDDGWPDKSEGTTVINEEGDATTLEHLLKSLDYIDECNYLRILNGSDELLTNDYMMAIAQVQLNWSKKLSKERLHYEFYHSSLFGVAENLHHLPRNIIYDPFNGWYKEEKELYDNGEKSIKKIGHFYNVINPKKKITGFAIADDYQYIYYGQIFSEDIYFEQGVETLLISEPSNLHTCHNEEDYDSFTDLPVPVKKETVAQYRAELLAYINAGGINPESLVENVSADSPLNDTPQVMYRIYNPNSGEHFYTSNTLERDYLVSSGWKNEGVGWTAPLSSNTPVYRLYNKNAGDHHYTMNRAEVIYLLENGWSYEGIGWYSDPLERNVLYRLYNPNAVSGSHHYTSDYNEVLSLQNKGWSFEDIGWYGL